MTDPCEGKYDIVSRLRDHARSPPDPGRTPGVSPCAPRVYASKPQFRNSPFQEPQSEPE